MLLEAASVQTIIREVPADLETPVSLYLKLRGQGASFLLESVEGGERIARYSFIGVQPRAEYILRNGQVEVKESGAMRVVPADPHSDPTRFLQDELHRFPVQHLPNTPRFTGGLVGYLGYEAVRYFEPTLDGQMHAAQIPDGIYLLADIVIAFDNVRRSIFLIANVLDGDTEAAESKLDQLSERISQPLPVVQKVPPTPSETSSNLTQEKFEAMVCAAKEHIAAGDIFQVVLSQRFTRQTNADPFDVYRAARRLNPSPYMFFFDFGLVDNEPLYLVGSSPEMFVRLEGRTASLRPIAGTRPRGVDPAADAALAEDLLADPKERAEHIMLVDLGRNDLGRVCEYGTVKISDFFTIERYSHVMHIVSHIEGTLRPGLTAFDLLRAAFPAGTVSGAPKVRAMEIISALEPDARGAYAGMVGYFGFNGAMDTCLAIRTMIGRGNSVSVQAGAGIVADSNPANEYQETVNKASALLCAIDLIEIEQLNPKETKEKPMLALIDNYDSFTYNLVQYFGELGADVRVFRNDRLSLDELVALNPDQLVISPGPGEPIKDGGVSADALYHFTGKVPVLGVCLGHQCLGAVYGGKVDRAPRLMHGKTSLVHHNGQGIFKDIPSPFEAMRYHSLVVYEPVPAELEVIATTAENEIMALKHRQHPTYGVQFHPESILTEHGKQLLKNYLGLKVPPQEEKLSC